MRGQRAHRLERAILVPAIALRGGQHQIRLLERGIVRDRLCQRGLDAGVLTEASLEARAYEEGLGAARLEALRSVELSSRASVDAARSRAKRPPAAHAQVGRVAPVGADGMAQLLDRLVGATGGFAQHREDVVLVGRRADVRPVDDLVAEAPRHDLVAALTIRRGTAGQRTAASAMPKPQPALTTQ